MRGVVLVGVAFAFASAASATIIETPYDTPEQFIQPGTLVIRGSGVTLPQGSGDTAPDTCTLGFILRQNGTQLLFATGAGHCHSNKTPVKHTIHGRWGLVVWQWETNPFYSNISHDIALISIDPHFQDNVEPAVEHLGGPTGIVKPGSLDSDTSDGNASFLAHCGIPGQLATWPSCVPRAGVLTVEMPEEWHCACLASKGDSGSPVIDLATGAAVGLISGGFPHVNVEPPGPLWDPGTTTPKRGVWFEQELAFINARAGLGNFTLVTANQTELGGGTW